MDDGVGMTGSGATEFHTQVCSGSKYGRQVRTSSFHRARPIPERGQATAFGNRRPACPVLGAISAAATA